MATRRRGSEWRKWDLHLHPPGTKLSDGYPKDSLDKFITHLEGSDVFAFGITDYFSFDGFITVRNRYVEMYPFSEKVLFPNMELRLNENVNRQGDQVDCHLILPPETSDTVLHGITGRLLTQMTDSRERRLPCSELSMKSHYESAVVSRADLRECLDHSFGPSWSESDALIVVPASNNGIRAESGKVRKESIADEIDKFCHAIFGGTQNVAWYLRGDRYADKDQVSLPKPVFACSDCHSLDHVQERLGRQVKREGENREVSWVKADLTYQGLLQTLIEPEERVRLQLDPPDQKEAFRVIKSVRFTAPGVFPDSKIEFNPNLVSIIGSRSAGKSALLAYMSHSVDPQYTVAQQIAAGVPEGEVGPAAGLKWADVADVTCEVEWASGAETRGQVVYIPQNSLFRVSERPADVTQKIVPVLRRLAPDLVSNYEVLGAELGRIPTIIRGRVDRWFELQDDLERLLRQNSDLGDPTAIAASRDTVAHELAEHRRSIRGLTPEQEAELRRVRGVLSDLERQEEGQRALTLDLNRLVDRSSDGICSNLGEGVRVELSFNTSGLPVPGPIAEKIESLRRDEEARISAKIVAMIAWEIGVAESAIAEFQDLRTRVAGDNSDLIARGDGDEGARVLQARIDAYEKLLGELREGESEARAIRDEQASVIRDIEGNLTRRQTLIDNFVSEFNQSPRRIGEMSFGVESDFCEEDLVAASEAFNKREASRYLGGSRRECVDLREVSQNVSSFLSDVRSGLQKLRAGFDARAAAAGPLSITPKVAFYADMEGDRIGGFWRSSMTPGKQALFALTLIIDESPDAWPLLLDQPEDDLDSRSIYGTIVPFLLRRKRLRQIIMVSHNANLVVGADSEQLIVANRHGDDRRNPEGRVFDYLTGSLEWTAAPKGSGFVLDSGGTREHACEILDGGLEAFQKRKEKYAV
ncbi:TrlF family AAA-like ATPase [Arsenicicoccus dermatophilus]|uniref:TrlF family AAA-like ATPase n=1 Tax=Arsenicicoccus dermatophilus TaxID=1076331 RepID=UPI0039176389